MKKEKRIPIHFDGRKIVHSKEHGFGGFKCSNCKSENGRRDFDVLTGEGLIQCGDCGYYRSFTFIRDEDGKFIRKDDTKDYGFYNLEYEEILFTNPYGAYYVECIQGDMGTGTLALESSYKFFVESMENQTHDEHEIVKAVVSRYISGEIVKEIIIPKTK